MATVTYTVDPNVISPTVVEHTFAPQPRYNLVPCLDGTSVVQLLGYLERKTITILWDSPDGIETTVRSYEVDGWVRENEVDVQFAVSESLGLYNAIARLVRFTPNGT